MDRLTTSRPVRSAMEAGRWGRAGAARAADPGRPLPALFQPASLSAAEGQALRAWLAGSAVLRPEQARCLLEQALDGRQLVHEPALHWRAVKARIAGSSNWAQMGFRLVLD